MAEKGKTFWTVTDLIVETAWSYWQVMGLLEELSGGDMDALKPGGRDIVLNVEQHKSFLALAAKRGPAPKREEVTK